MPPTTVSFQRYSDAWASTYFVRLMGKFAMSNYSSDIYFVEGICRGIWKVDALVFGKTNDSYVNLSRGSRPLSKSICFPMLLPNRLVNFCLKKPKHDRTTDAVRKQNECFERWLALYGVIALDLSLDQKDCKNVAQTFRKSLQSALPHMANELKSQREESKFQALGRIL